jgi:hypothetical protein
MHDSGRSPGFHSFGTLPAANATKPAIMTIIPKTRHAW